MKKLLSIGFAGLGKDSDFFMDGGHILSPNAELISVETVPPEFEHSDHNPVRLQVALQ